MTDPIRPKDRFLVFGAPLIEQDEIDEVTASMRARWLGTGPKVARFERDFLAYQRAEGHAIAVASCTAALHLSLIASGVGPGDEVITTPLTFCATVNAIIHAGATPVLADVEPGTMNLDPRAVEAAITPRTRAIVPVHFAGRPCDMEALGALAGKHGLKIIEDCAHAIETEIGGRHVGTFGELGCFSFYVTKNVITAEGGLVMTKDDRLAARIRSLSLHGMSHDAWKRFSDEGYKHYQVVECGYKYNMTDLQASIGIHQLKRVERSRARRQEIWSYYDRALASLPLTTPTPPSDGTTHALHLYTVLVDEARAGLTRDQFLSALTRHNIGVGVHYMSVPEHPYYQQRFGWRPEAWPHAMRIGRQTASLPISPAMSLEDADDVVRATRAVLDVAGR